MVIKIIWLIPKNFCTLSIKMLFCFHNFFGNGLILNSKTNYVFNFITGLKKGLKHFEKWNTQIYLDQSIWKVKAVVIRKMDGQLLEWICEPYFSNSSDVWILLVWPEIHLESLSPFRSESLKCESLSLHSFVIYFLCVNQFKVSSRMLLWIRLNRC